MNNIVLNYVAEKEKLLRDFLKNKEISKKTLTRIKFDEDGSIKVNGKECNVRYVLQVGDKVSVTLPSETFSEHIRFIKDNINIVYEDDYFLIVNKEANLPTIPSRNEEDSSLLEKINYYFKKNNYSGIPHIVTRLDKNTTGLVLVAKHRHLHALFSKHNIDKFYLALVNGKIKKHQIIEKNIARVDSSIIERTISEDGDYAKTELWCDSYLEEKNISVLKLKLYTGRTHQIRVHCASIGYPLLGDTLYGGDNSLIKRQALHCERLIFTHPITNELLDVKAQLPTDIITIIFD